MSNSSKGLYLDLTGLEGIESKLPPLSSSEMNRINAQLELWQQSDFAGFRKVLDQKNVEAPDLKKIEALVGKHRLGSTGRAMQRCIVLGTGGSSLGTEAIIKALIPAGTLPEVLVYDNNDPSFFVEAMKLWRAETTLFYVVSKSGATPETLSQFLVVREWLINALPKSANWQQHFVFCTDPVKGDLRKLAQQENVSCLDVPSTVGGRFSVLTAVGLFPAAFAGLNAGDFLTGAREVEDRFAGPLANTNEALRLARLMVCDPARNITVMMPYSSHLSTFSRWFCQLWAESLGKVGKGFTPYPALGTTDQHSQVQLYMEGPRDKTVGFFTVKNATSDLPLPIWQEVQSLASFKQLAGYSMSELFKAEFCATRDALVQNGVPVFTVELESLSAKDLGALFYFWELVTTFAGALLQVNPFDQPGVELGKILTRQYLLASKATKTL
jgi:glucose-6-phosphate isomerase